MSDPYQPKPTVVTNERFKPNCVYCDAPWSDDNVKVGDIDAEYHCAEGRYYSPQCTILISCHTCGREMYRKENATFY